MNSPRACANPQTVIEQKFIRPAQVQSQYGIKAGKLYDLIGTGKVRSVRLSDGKKGTRLVNVESLDAYLDGLAEKQTGGQTDAR